jgi:hypothetical protein
MPSFSSYAVPLELDLSPGTWERMALGLIALAAVAGILLSGGPLPVKGSLTAIAAALAAFYWQNMRRRPQRMTLFADGEVSCSSDADAQPAELLQSSSYLGLTQLHLRDFSWRHHRLVLFPDRVDARARHRLRVWLATHRPDPDASDGKDPRVERNLNRQRAVVTL